MEVLTQPEIETQLRQKLRNWTYSDTHIHREITFGNFIEAFSFMTAVAFEAEKMDHHPDWTNAYNKVSINLSTHMPKGITHNDLELASKIDSILEGSGKQKK